MTEELFTCNLCEALCGIRLEVEERGDDRVVRSVRGDPDDPLSRGHICPKAHGLLELLEDPDRLRAPVRRSATGFEPVPWSTAFDEIAARIRAIQREHGKDAVAFYVGNPAAHSHRGTLASQLLAVSLGTKNRFDANSQDANPRLFACMQMFGDALALPVPDVERVDYLLMLGANPAASNGSLMSLGDPRGRFADIRARGGRVVLVDPRRTETASWVSRHHFIRPGGDAALLFSILHVLFLEELVDAAYVRSRASGLTELERLARFFSPARVAPAIGMTEDEIVTIARELAGSPRACVYARVGVCQNEFGVVASWLVEAINVVTGNFDREGGVMFPSPAADIGPLARLLVGNAWGRWRSRVRGLPEFLGSLPAATMAEEMETPGKGQVRALVCLAGNPVLSTPNGDRLAKAIAGLPLVVSLDIYLNETSRLAHYVLPAKHVFETGSYDLLLSRFSVRNAAKYSPPILPTRGDAKDDWESATEIALRILVPSSPALRSALRRALRDAPERLVDLLLRMGPERLSLKDLRRARHGIDLGPLRPAGRRVIRTPDRRVVLSPAALVLDVPRLERWVDTPREGGALVLIGRRHVRSNNSWLHNLRSLAKGPDRAQLLMHPDDASQRGLSDGGLVRLRSRAGEVTATLRVTGDMAKGTVSLPHGFGHGSAKETLRVAGSLSGSSANALTDELFVEPIIGTSILNGVPVRVEGTEAPRAAVEQALS